MPVSGIPEEILEEIFLRLPPDEPGCLFRASAVCKPWRSLVTSPSFASRYRKHHSTPPLLGFFEIHDVFGCWFASSSPISPFPPIHPDSRDLFVVDCRHGLVLLRTPGWLDGEHVERFIVWDPVSRLQWEFPPPEFATNIVCDTTAVVLRSDDRLSCRGGPFTVVFVGTAPPHASIFSSETRAWSSVDTIPQPDQDPEMMICGPKALVRNVLYFACCEDSILRYDLLTRQLSMIDGPEDWCSRSILMETDEGLLGWATIEESELCLYSMDTRPDGDVEWTERRSIEIEEDSHDLIGFVDGLFYLRADSCIFAVELKSGRVKKIPVNCLNATANNTLIPYTSFYTPDQAGQGKGEERGGWEEVSAEKVYDKEDDHQEEAYVQELFDSGSKAIKNFDFVYAINCFRRVLKIRVAHHGKLSPKCFSTYLEYGRALACEILLNTRYSTKDFSLPWRMLHVGRSILEKNPGNTMEKVEMFAALIDVSIHGDIDYFLIACLKALAISEHLVERDHRPIFNQNLQIHFAFELESKIGDAQAISLCMSNIENLKRANKDFLADKSDDASAAQFKPFNLPKCIEFFSGKLLSALGKKLEDLEPAISSPVSEANGDENVDNDVPRTVALASSQFNVKQISSEPSPKKFREGSP